MNSRERLLAALDHVEPDRIPLDLGSTQVTGIHVGAYEPLRAFMGLPPVEPVICDAIQQLALPDEDLLDRLGVDTRGLFPLNSHNWNVVGRRDRRVLGVHRRVGHHPPAALPQRPLLHGRPPPPGQAGPDRQ